MVMQKTELDIYIGKLLNNRYLIRDLIGKGGMGRVYLAEDAAKGGMPVAVKILSLSLINQQMSQRFGREIFIGAQLGRKSEHIVRVLSYGITDDNIPFYVMEYLQGKNLKQIIKTQPLSVSKFLDFTYQVCLGLDCAHQGISLKGEIYPIVHRDIKPENIFITEGSKKGEVAKILDFGIAKFLTERGGMTLTDSFIGSLPYCSPEHMEGRKLLDVRSDIYSLGVMMFEMLTGKNPFPIKNGSFSSWYQAHRFQAPTPFSELITDVEIPQKVEQLILSCLAKEVGDRPQDISEILETITDIKNNPKNKTHEKTTAVQLIPVTALSEKECLQKTWPKNKPIASIGFPHLLHTPQGTIPSFWAMLPKEEINKFIHEGNHTEFIAKMNVYPMVLWAIVLYDVETALTKWLTYFLDLKDARGQKILRSLAEVGYYHLLFFAVEEPSKCSHVITLSLNANQRQQIVDWLDTSQNSQAFITATQAKIVLKAEYEKLKPAIVEKVAANQKNRQPSARTWVFKLVSKFLNLLSRP
jgi:serine/threonine-protein kinase